MIREAGAAIWRFLTKRIESDGEATPYAAIGGLMTRNPVVGAAIGVSIDEQMRRAHEADTNQKGGA